ncbi:MAG: MBL fold metallo-hydrolase [Acidimicrobiia bacterium]|nr:MBL fold metallo-hydrolase [Acidimicrobiia bacterium]
MFHTSEVLWVAATNTHVISTEPGGLGVIIDAPPDPDGVVSLLESYDITPVALLVTHGHIDHAGGVGEVVRRTGVSAYVHPDDDFLTMDPETQLRRLFGAVPPGEYAPPDNFQSLTDGENLELGGFSIEVRQTPGHTPGHCVFYLPDEGVLFSGDQLFAGSVGRTDLPGGDQDALWVSMKRRVMDLEDEVRVLTGHGEETTIGRERATNPFRGYWEQG